MQERFEKSDKSLRFMELCLKVIMYVTIFLGIAGMIVMFVLASVFYYTAWLYMLIGIGAPIVMTLSAVLTYKIGMYRLWKAYDQKMIRNALYQLPESETLQRFGGGKTLIASAAEPTCPQCGAKVNGRKFCGKCGTKLG